MRQIILCHNSIQTDSRTHHTMQSLSSDGTIPFNEWINVDVNICVEVTSRPSESIFSCWWEKQKRYVCGVGIAANGW